VTHRGGTVTEHDRWWLAYCLFGLGLIIRAPAFSTALGVFAVWAVVLAVLSIRALRDVLNNAVVTARTCLGKLSASKPIPARHPGWYENQARKNQSDYSPTAMPPAAPTLADLPRVPPNPLPPQSAVPLRAVVRDPAETVIRVQLAGTLWTTAELLADIQAAVARAKPRRDGEASGAPMPPG
jgi:hypothetical protein